MRHSRGRSSSPHCNCVRVRSAPEKNVDSVECSPSPIHLIICPATVTGFFEMPVVDLDRDFSAFTARCRVVIVFERTAYIGDLRPIPAARVAFAGIQFSITTAAFAATIFAIIKPHSRDFLDVHAAFFELERGGVRKEGTRNSRLIKCRGAGTLQSRNDSSSLRL